VPSIYIDYLNKNYGYNRQVSSRRNNSNSSIRVRSSKQSSNPSSNQPHVSTYTNMYNQASSEFGFTGMTNDKESVKKLQSALNEYLGKTGGYQSLAVDGLLGNNTYQALQEAKNRITKDGNSWDSFYNGSDNFALRNLININKPS